MCQSCGCVVTAHSPAKAEHHPGGSHNGHHHEHDSHEHPSHGHHHGDHDHSHRHASVAADAANGHEVLVLKRLLEVNDAEAAHNRAHLDAKGVLAINLMSSPGSGKTALLEATIEATRTELSMAVIEGDLETENDARRIRAHGVPAVQITTGNACHLDARMVHDGLHDLDLHGLDLLFIENVGNLVCPATFDLGHHLNVVLLSVTEGDDKPAKYPVMFRAADVVLITKSDLLHVIDDFRPERAEAAVRNLGRDVPVIFVSTRAANGLQAWLEWLGSQLANHRVAGRFGSRSDLRTDHHTTHHSNPVGELAS